MKLERMNQHYSPRPVSQWCSTAPYSSHILVDREADSNMLSRCVPASISAARATILRRYQHNVTKAFAVSNQTSQSSPSTSISRCYTSISSIDVAERTKRMLDAKAESG